MTTDQLAIAIDSAEFERAVFAVVNEIGEKCGQTPRDVADFLDSKMLDLVRKYADLVVEARESGVRDWAVAVPQLAEAKTLKAALRLADTLDFYKGHLPLVLVHFASQALDIIEAS